MLNIILQFLFRAVKSVGTTAITPVLEKNVLRTLGTLGNDSQLVVSMSRLIALAFAVVMIRQFWHSGIGGWPNATLGIATVLALPIMNVLDRANPDEVLALTRLLLAKMGGTDPSKFDDHTTD
jgi:hypothetical protein